MITIQTLTILLDKCSISPLGSSLIIVCPSTSIFAKLAKFRKFLPKALMSCHGEEIKTSLIQKRIKHITIAVRGRRASFPVDLEKALTMDIDTVIQIPSRQLLVSVIDLIDECMRYDGACGVIRMSDHKGLFSNSQIVLSSNAHPNDWLGKKMSDWWIKPELDKYLKRLYQDGELKNYSYVAKMMTGENARLTVDARVVVWNGEPARLVKTISRELLS